MKRGIRILSPTTYLRNSGGTKWTAEENKRFENALALFDRDTPDRWQKVAAMIPGKTAGDVMKQYRALLDDVTDIEAGLIPVPGYAAGNSFVLEWSNDGAGFGQVYGGAGRPSDQGRKKGVPWTEEEHRQFLMGLKKYGKGDWRNISRNFVKTRTPTQVASHAQKYFIRQLNGGKDKRRSSIHDITIVNLPDNPTQSNPKNNMSPSHSTGINHLHQSLSPPSIETMARYCNRTSPSPSYGGVLVAPFCGISSLGPKLLQDQIFIRGNQNSGPYCPNVFQVQVQREREQHYQ